MTNDLIDIEESLSSWLDDEILQKAWKLLKQPLCCRNLPCEWLFAGAPIEVADYEWKILREALEHFSVVSFQKVLLGCSPVHWLCLVKPWRKLIAAAV